jgi:hypothetical protein
VRLTYIESCDSITLTAATKAEAVLVEAIKDFMVQGGTMTVEVNDKRTVNFIIPKATEDFKQKEIPDMNMFHDDKENES